MSIQAGVSGNYKHLLKVSILDARKVFFPLNYLLQKRDIIFDDDQALIIHPIPEDVKFPGSAKLTDAGTLRTYKIEISINNQDSRIQEQLESLECRKVIVVFHFIHERMIFGCNEMPMDFSFNEDNSLSPGSDNGFTVLLNGNSYFLKVSV